MIKEIKLLIYKWAKMIRIETNSEHKVFESIYEALDHARDVQLEQEKTIFSVTITRDEELNAVLHIKTIKE